MIRAYLASLSLFAIGLMAAKVAIAERLPELIPETQPAPKADFSSASNFDELRLAYAKRADFSNRCEQDRPGKAFMERVNAKDFQGAVQITERWLEHCPIDARVHLWTMAAYGDLENKELSDRHRNWFLGLTDSALKTGSGKTTDDPIETISVEEEYAVLIRLRLELVKQELVKGPTLLDAMHVKDEQGNGHILYFNPEWHFIRLAHMFPEEGP